MIKMCINVVLLHCMTMIYTHQIFVFISVILPLVLMSVYYQSFCSWGYVFGQLYISLLRFIFWFQKGLNHSKEGLSVIIYFSNNDNWREGFCGRDANSRPFEVPSLSWVSRLAIPKTRMIWQEVLIFI